MEIAFRVAGTTDLWEIFEISADWIRLQSFNTSSNAASPGFRFKTGRNETGVSGFGHSAAYLSRRTATTWRVAQSHAWFDRVRIEFLPSGGGGGGVVVKKSSDTTDPAPDSIISLLGSQFNVVHSPAGTASVSLQGYLPTTGGDDNDVWTRNTVTAGWEAPASGGSVFSVHDDVTRHTVTPVSADDRFVLSDESDLGDPNEYVTYSEIVDGIYEQLESIGTGGSAIAADDRILIFDESSDNEAARYMSAGQFSSYLGSGGTEVSFGTSDSVNFETLTVGGVTRNARGDPSLGTAELTASQITDEDSEIPVVYISGSPEVREIRHLKIDTIRSTWITHQGGWSNRDYQQGAVVSTGTGDRAQFWIASEAVAAGSDEPSFSDPGVWFHLGHRAEFLGDLGNTPASFDFFEGSSWLYDDEFYIATADLLDTSTTVAATHANVVHITDPFHGKDALTTTPADDDLVLFFDTSGDAPVTRTVTQARADLGGGGGDPTQIGSDFIATAMSAHLYAATGIAMPSSGWLRVIGVCDKGNPSDQGDFSYYAPIARFTDLAASVAGIAAQAVTNGDFLSFGPDTLDGIYVGRTSANELLLACEQPGPAEFRAYDR